MHVHVAYATEGGHTRRVAEHLAADARASGHHVVLQNVGADDAPPSDDADLVVLCSAVYHRQMHPAIVRFVRTFRPALEDRDTALVAVSLAAALDDDDGLAIDDVDGFVDETGFEPDHLALAAGAWTPSQWDEATRTSIGTAAWRMGLSFDEDRVLTDWDGLSVATRRWWAD